MKKARIINFTIWATIVAAVVAMVIHKWYLNECDWRSFIAAFVYYAGIGAALSFVVDERIRQHYQKQ